MSKKEWTSPMELPELASQAWEAYEQKRTRECLALTKALVLADPENAEAHALQSAIRADMQRDLNDARALLEDCRTQDSPQKHRKAAEVILLKTLYLDPDHEEAKVLLSTVRALAASDAPALAGPRPVPAAKPAPAPIPVFRHEHAASEELPFVVAGPPTHKPKEKSRPAIPA
jgi:hypothetical protein